MVVADAGTDCSRMSDIISAVSENVVNACLFTACFSLLTNLLCFHMKVSSFLFASVIWVMNISWGNEYFLLATLGPSIIFVFAVVM